MSEKNSSEVSPPLSNGLMLSFFLEYLTALSRFRWNKSASTEFRTALVLVPWRISVFLPVSTWRRGANHQRERKKEQTQEPQAHGGSGDKRAYELRRVLEELPLGAVALGRPDRHHLLLLLRLRSIDAAATGRWSRRRAASGGAVSLVCRGRGGKRWMDGWDWREAERLDGSDRS